MGDVYVLFGEMGSGKNHMGELLARRLGCDFYDGDDALPDYLRRKVDRRVPLTLSEVRDFVRNDLAPAIQSRYDGQFLCPNPGPGNLVVAQALYREAHRDVLAEALKVDGIVWIHVRPPSLLTHLRRLLSRPRGLSWVLMGLMSKPFFEHPVSERRALELVSHDGLDINDWINYNFRELVR